MKGLVIWSQSACRSVAGLYAAVKDVANFPVKITLYHCDRCSDNLRSRIGLRNEEFSNVEMIPIGNDYDKAVRFLDDVHGYYHVFCIWQQAPSYRRLMKEICQRGGSYAIACEAPCNMKCGWRYYLQKVYYRTLLPVKGRDVIRNADFFLNYSGCDDVLARQIGWPSEKIIPFGYFPPPLEGSHFVGRVVSKPFVILSTGVLSYYRGADVLVEALRILTLKGIQYRAIITQEGELLDSLKRKAQKFSLPIEFTGYVPMDKLIELYESCSVYVGAGRREPWGMRLNDALNCGAPIVVSRGMGGVKMVDDYSCGLAFENENPLDLASKLEMLITDEALYERCAKCVPVAVAALSPRAMAKRFVDICRMHAKMV